MRLMYDVRSLNFLNYITQIFVFRHFHQVLRMNYNWLLLNISVCLYFLFLLEHLSINSLSPDASYCCITWRARAMCAVSYTHLDVYKRQAVG